MMNKTQHTAFSAEDRKAIENSGISASLASNPQMNLMLPRMPASTLQGSLIL